MLGLAALVTLGSTTALAAPPDVSNRQMQVKQALTVFDLGVTQDRFEEANRGRRDLVMVSNQSSAQVLSALKSAYLDETRLPNGYKVAGWAHLVHSDSTTFTLKNSDGDRMIAEVFDEGGRAKVKVWGFIRKDNPPVKPFNEVPHRYAPIKR
jgi:hypothetical protein